MRPSDDRPLDECADVCLVLEGTYPYVKGGVSTWVHHLIGGLSEVQFAVVHIGPEPGTYSRRLYSPPPNLVALSDLYCREPRARLSETGDLRRVARAERHRHATTPGSSRVLRGIRRLHLDDPLDPSVLDDLGACDLSVGAFLHGRETYEVVEELYERLAPDGSFLDFFWHFRSMHLPLVRLLGTVPIAAASYHAVCTGYAGLLAAVWSRRMSRPLVLTEHGIYSRERRLELDRAAWLDPAGMDHRSNALLEPGDSPTTSALRAMWARFFRSLARCAYDQASVVVSLCEASRNRQIADGAAPHRTLVIPNGIDLDVFLARTRRPTVRAGERHPIRVGFVGRLVPIKDVVTFIRACHLTSATVGLVARIVGPMDEDPAYVQRCRRLVSRLGLESTIRFEGPAPIERIYAEMDVLVLTSLSEGQPLVVLEAAAAGIPVVVTDVGACRELVEGREECDRRLGPSGIVTRLAAPEETALALARLARDPELRRAMGEAGRRRVANHYRETTTLSSYRALYREWTWPALAGDSTA